MQLSFELEVNSLLEIQLHTGKTSKILSCNAMNEYRRNPKILLVIHVANKRGLSVLEKLNAYVRATASAKAS